MPKFNNDKGTSFELIDIDKLAPYKRNARVHSKEQIKKICASIQEFGFISPCIVDATNGLIAGHGRVEAAKQLGITHVPCVRVEHLTEAQKRAYIIADNRLAELSEWDVEKLELEINDLKEMEFDFRLTGFDELDKKGEHENPYTKKIQTPIYEPKGDKPNENDLCDDTKTNQLLEEIKHLDAPKNVKQFLSLAANRHTVFNYSQIAEYYCHAPIEVQELMEKSALVVIDVNKAIENGFANFSQEIAEAYSEQQ